MMTDIEAYKLDCKKYFEDIEEIKASSDPEETKKIKELGEKFRDKIRKYLPTCLNIINSNFDCKFSLYKVGKDYNAAFKVIETNVRKTKQEVEAELQSLRNTKDISMFDANTQNQINLACDILTTYVDDGAKPKFSQEYLNSAVPVASSIITNTPQMSQERVNERSQLEQNNMNFNPYANQPIDLNADTNNFSAGGNTPLINPSTFNNSIGTQDAQIQSQPAMVQPTQSDFVSTGIKTDNEYAYSDVIDASSLSIFGVNNNNNNN